MTDLVWLIPALPLAGFLLLLVFGRRLGEPAAGWVGTVACAGSFGATLVVFAGLLGAAVFHTQLAQRQLRIDSLEKAVDEQRELFDELRPGDRIEVEHTVTIGPRKWTAKQSGKVVRTERLRAGLPPNIRTARRCSRHSRRSCRLAGILTLHKSWLRRHSRKIPTIALRW